MDATDGVDDGVGAAGVVIDGEDRGPFARQSVAGRRPDARSARTRHQRDASGEPLGRAARSPR
jgi:hypothetical protein